MCGLQGGTRARWRTSTRSELNHDDIGNGTRISYQSLVGGEVEDAAVGSSGGANYESSGTISSSTSKSRTTLCGWGSAADKQRESNPPPDAMLKSATEVPVRLHQTRVVKLEEGQSNLHLEQHGQHLQGVPKWYPGLNGPSFPWPYPPGLLPGAFMWPGAGMPTGPAGGLQVQHQCGRRDCEREFADGQISWLGS